MNSWLIRYGELALKGKNRHLFEKKLINNMKSFLRNNKLNHTKILKPRGRIIIFSDDDCSILKNVFGLVSISPAIECKAEIKDICETIEKYFLKKIKENFRVTTKRIDKRIELRSNFVDREIGAFIVEKTNKKVKLKNFESEIGIELVNKKAYIFNKRIKTFGGLPLGIEGEVYTLIEDESSLLTSWLIMRRGCNIIPIAFKKYDINLLNKYNNQNTELKIIKSLKELDNKKALIVNDTLKSLKNYEFKGLILRPLIAYSKEEIKEKLSTL
ncbi:MAG: THUMP domain-containing protein [Nanoarchaeota archaeon]|nr:THUMP domain-containing protein [Nanoarchaeota archaeon]